MEECYATIVDGDFLKLYFRNHKRRINKLIRHEKSDKFLFIQPYFYIDCAGYFYGTVKYPEKRGKYIDICSPAEYLESIQEFPGSRIIPCCCVTHVDQDYCSAAAQGYEWTEGDPLGFAQPGNGYYDCASIFKDEETYTEKRSKYIDFKTPDDFYEYEHGKKPNLFVKGKNRIHDMAYHMLGDVKTMSFKITRIANPYLCKIEDYFEKLKPQNIFE